MWGNQITVSVLGSTVVSVKVCVDHAWLRLGETSCSPSPWDGTVKNDILNSNSALRASWVIHDSTASKSRTENLMTQKWAFNQASNFRHRAHLYRLGWKSLSSTLESLCGWFGVPYLLKSCGELFKFLLAFQELFAEFLRDPPLPLQLLFQGLKEDERQRLYDVHSKQACFDYTIQHKHQHARHRPIIKNKT